MLYDKKDKPVYSNQHIKGTTAGRWETVAKVFCAILAGNVTFAGTVVNNTFWGVNSDTISLRKVIL